MFVSSLSDSIIFVLFVYNDKKCMLLCITIKTATKSPPPIIFATWCMEHPRKVDWQHPRVDFKHLTVGVSRDVNLDTCISEIQHQEQNIYM